MKSVTENSRYLRFALKGRLLALLALVAIVAVGADVVRAQGGGGGASISGIVTDGTGATIPGASVKVQNLETGAIRDLATDSAGRYEAPLLPVGPYTVSVEKTGFQPETRSGITLVVGQRAVVDIALHLGSVEQTITVTEQPNIVEVTTGDVSGLVNSTQVKELPLNGRSYDQLLTLNPGVVNYTSQRAGGIGTSTSVVGNMFSASGHRPQDNLFLLNGVEFTGASQIDSTPGGVSGQLLGVDAVREFSVVTDTYGAEYGKRSGAQINIVTASGSNDLHGNAYEFLRNSALDSRNYFDFGDIPPFERNVFGGSLGGPIKKNKTFIFGNYEGFRQKLGLSDVTLVPDNTSRAAAVASIKPTLALWPVANGPEVLTLAGGNSGIAEAFSHPLQHIREDFGSARIDQIFSDKDSLAGVYTIDDSTGLSPTNNPITFANINLREQVASLSETHVFTSNLINRATFGYSRGAFYFNSATTVSLPGWIHAGQPVGALVVGGGTTVNGASQITNGGTNASSNLTTVRNLFTGADEVTFTRGKHLLTFGVWTERVQSNDTLVADQYGQASFTSLTTFLTGTVSTYTYAPSFTPLNWRSLEAAFYVEDSIKLRPDLELTLGFRGESTNGMNEANGRASNYLFNANGVIQTTPVVGGSALATNNATLLPEPRIGIAWSPLGSKTTVVRAGFGIYYSLIDNLSYRLDQNPPYNTVFAVKGSTGHTFTYSEISPTTNYTALGFTDSVIPSGVQPDLKTPTVESYSLKIEQQISKNTSVTVGYTGSHGYHQLLSIDANLPNGTTPFPTQVITATSTGLANPAVWNTTHWFSDGISFYNGLNVDVNHRFSHGLQFRGVYTYSKALDDGDSMNTSVATNSPAFASNPRDLRSDYGRASFDIRNFASINATYDLPFVRGTAAGAKSWDEKVLGNWQISAIETLQSGLPFTPQLSYNPSNDGDTRNPVRPSYNPSFSGPIIEGGPGRYFNPEAFIQPAAGTYGNVGRDVLQGPGIATTDISLSKRIALTERFNLQFRSEFFNIFNRVNFNTPNPVVYTAAAPALPSPTAGVITSTSTSSRQIQFGLKLLF